LVHFKVLLDDQRLLLIALAAHRRDLGAQGHHLVGQLPLHLLQLADVLLEDRRIIGVQRPIHQPVQVSRNQDLNFTEKGCHDLTPYLPPTPFEGRRSVIKASSIERYTPSPAAQERGQGVRLLT
jgi:hypothetical protein